MSDGVSIANGCGGVKLIGQVAWAGLGNIRLDNPCLNMYRVRIMGSTDAEGQVKRTPRGRRFDSPQQEAYLILWRTYDRLRMLEDELFGRHDLTAQQYNALRLLRGAHPGRVATLALSGRLVSRAPDITRLVD